MTSTLAIAWRDAVAALRTPGRVVEAAGLAGAGTMLCLLNAERPVAVAAATILVYLGASRMLWPLRSELDMIGRARVLLRPRIGRILLAHSLLPVIVTTAAAVLAVACCHHPWGAFRPWRRRGVGRRRHAADPDLVRGHVGAPRRAIAHTVLVTAVTVDPSGGGLATLSWLTYWPTGQRSRYCSAASPSAATRWRREGAWRSNDQLP